MVCGWSASGRKALNPTLAALRLVHLAFQCQCSSVNTVVQAPWLKPKQKPALPHFPATRRVPRHLYYFCHNQPSRPLHIAN